MTSTTNLTPQTVYRQHAAGVRALLAEIDLGVAAAERSAGRIERIDFGDVGDVAEIRDQLEAVADSLYSRGEHAPENVDGERNVVRAEGRRARFLEAVKIEAANRATRAQERNASTAVKVANMLANMLACGVTDHGAIAREVANILNAES